MVLAPALLALAQALDERVGEAVEVARCLPDPGVLDDRRVEGDDVVALLQHRPPPLAFDVVLEQDAVVAVVVGRADPAVDLRGGEDEAPALAEGDDLVHRHLDGRCSLLGGCHSRTVPAAIIPHAVPIYEYKCENGHVFDVIQKFSDEPLTECQECGAPAVRVLHPAGDPLQGLGLPQHRLRKKSGSGNGGGSTGGDGSSSGDSSDSGSSDSKSSDSKSSDSGSGSGDSSGSGDKATASTGDESSR